MNTKTQRHKKRAATTKKRKKRTKRPFDPGARLWSVPEAAAWSGVPYKLILTLVKARVIDAISIGNEVLQTVTGKVRTRACSKYMILSKPFIAWVEGLGAGSKVTVTKTAA